MAINKRLIKSNDGGAVVVPTENFNTVIWSGDGTTNRSINVGFAPDWVWVKERSPEGLSHNMYDTVRGAGLRLISNLTAAESTLTEGVKSFDSNGFTVGNSIAVNRSGSNFVAWSWKAGGAAVSNTDGSITSTVSANPDAGFSVVSYTGNGTAGATVGHGLSSAPEFIFIKSRSNIGNWQIYNKTIGNTKALRFNTNVPETGTAFFNDTSPTSTVFSLGTLSDGNANSTTYIAYCFHSVDGYQKVGSYSGVTGTKTVSGLGFEPRFLIIKRTDNTGDWLMYDSIRGTGVPSKGLIANSSTSEFSDSTNTITFTSDGFEVAGDYSHLNISGGTYIYLAIA